jgi:hypothetical protein
LADGTGVKVKVQSVKKEVGERLSFSCVDEDNGRAFSCTPSRRFMQTHPPFDVKVDDELLVGDFIPDLITKEVGRIHLVPERIEKWPSGSVA